MAAYATVTLTGTYQTPDGTPHKGVVEIIPSERVIKDTTGDVILTGRVKVRLGHPAAEGEAGAENGWVHDGKFTVALPATDDPTLNPTGFGYTLAAKLHSTHLPAVSFSLPAATPVVDIEDVTPVDPSTFVAETTYAESSELAAVETRVTTVETDKANSADLATVATTGAYTDLTGQPSIPSTAADVGAEPAGLSAETDAALAATFGNLANVLGKTLDIWDPRTLPATYAEFLAEVDAELTGATKVDRGVCSDGVQHVYTYTAGNGPNRVLLVGGTHGGERHGASVTSRWFQQFMNHPLMGPMRDTFTVTLIPCLSPWAYDNLSRINANAVDPNRNFPFYWDRFVDDAQTAKGAAALDQPESKIVKTVVDEIDPIAVFDVHNLATGDTMAYAAPSPWVHSNRQAILSAVERTKRQFPTRAFAIETGTAYSPAPNLTHWANWYMRFQKNRPDAIAMTIESSDLFADNTAGYTGRVGMQAFGCLLNNVLATWHHNNKPEQGYPLHYIARRSTWQDTVDVSAGGTKLVQAAEGTLTFNDFHPVSGVVTSDSLLLPIPYPCTLYIEAAGWMESGGAYDPGVTERIEVAVLVDGAAAVSGATYFQMPTTAGNRTDWNLTQRVTKRASDGFPDAASVVEVKLRFKHQAWPGATHLVKATKLAVTIIPQGTENEHPLIQP